MTSKSPVRSAEDVDEQALSYAEIKMLATGNPYIKEKMDLDIDVSKLKLLKANHLSQKYALEDKIIKELPLRISTLEQRIEGYIVDIETAPNNTFPNEDGFSPMTVDGINYTEKKDAGFAILAACKAMKNPEPVSLGEYRGFKMELCFESFSREYVVTLIGKLRHNVPLGTDVYGNIQRLDNAISSMDEKLASCKEQLENARVQLENAKVEVEKPFPREEELKQKTVRLSELNSMLNLDKTENDIVDDDREEADEEPERKEKDRDSR